MRKVCSVILKVIAGFFFYTVSMLAFVSEPSTSVKLIILAGFSLPAVIALICSLALTSFRNWRLHTGVVLLSTSGFSTFVIFTFTCLLMSETFPKVGGTNTLTFFSDYLTGGSVIVGLAVLGWVLVAANTGISE